MILNNFLSAERKLRTFGSEILSSLLASCWFPQFMLFAIFLISGSNYRIAIFRKIWGSCCTSPSLPDSDICFNVGVTGGKKVKIAIFGISVHFHEHLHTPQAVNAPVFDGRGGLTSPPAPQDILSDQVINSVLEYIFLAMSLELVMKRLYGHSSLKYQDRSRRVRIWHD
ncbi:uncharacterized protein EI90DRAFT_3075047 [Cantharellus anzutake]|uniref:uncharacterized protein n=1 Tax=Cantharellus anzutake TaxID=1750568 RepID=UPI0019058F68|nr:uncharacterized protein EI90DRAFT_3075047 [Cantharellus anzutake]KAF8324553.1 hypothetical protein EI90DRAFT_3075047 [Cantharellus anzutake]